MTRPSLVCGPQSPKEDDAFFTTVRERVDKYLATSGYGGRQRTWVSLFELVATVALSVACWWQSAYYKSWLGATLLGFLYARLGYVSGNTRWSLALRGICTLLSS